MVTLSFSMPDRELPHVTCSAKTLIHSGRTFRLKGKGLKAKGGSGDLLATVRIMLPEQADDTFTEMMKSWRDKKPYDPRGGME